MVKVAYILLCHKDPDAVIMQAERLTATGDAVSIHFDRSAGTDAFARIRRALDANPNVTFAKRRVKCGWGEWSLVAATIEAVRAAVEAFPDATHFYMVSGDCMPIKSAEYIHAYLAGHDADFIESEDFFQSDWIRTGWKEERLHYHHFLNERDQPTLFYAMFRLQQKLGLKRQLPADLDIMIGSQWWCLRRATIAALLQFMNDRKDVVRFFRTTWIPDETFFQTLVRHLVPETQIRSRTLTFLLFSDYGMPVTFYNDHFDLLLSQDALFARKVSSEAQELKQRLGLLYAAKNVSFEISNEGRKLFDFLTGRGRIGRRFATRFWETESTLGRDRELLIIVCKKWHVARRLLDRIRQATNVPALEYLFNEEDADLPDLGGIHNSLEKRHRHRRSMMRMLFDYFGTDRLIICLDPSSLDLLQDFEADRSTTRILEVECQFSEEDLIGHAMRVGLAGEQTSRQALARLLPTIQNELVFESDRINDAGFTHLVRMAESATDNINAQAMASFLSVPHDQAQEITRQEGLFAN